MKIKEITDYLETFFPLSRAYDWDHCGLQIGDLQQTVDSMMIALTPDLSVIQECIDQDIHFLFTHHPLFFSSFNPCYVKRFTSLLYNYHYGLSSVFS